MIPINRVIFWEPSASPHKISLISSLAQYQKNVEVICCSQVDVSKERREQGWDTITANNCEILVQPTESKILALTNSHIDTTVHIFSGIRHVPIICSAIDHVIKKNGLYYIMSEPRSFEGLSGYIRLFQSWLFEQRFRKSALGIFAIGANGRRWFKMAGYSNKKIFDFAYYLDFFNVQLLPEKKVNQCRLLYIGRINEMKGVKYLIDAGNQLGANYPLRVVGIGEQKTELELISASHINFEGSVPSVDVPQIISESDILILPSVSDNDGWGAVVSEALLQGCAVIVTDKVGASSIVLNDRIGRVIHAKNANAIMNAINNIVDTNVLNIECRNYRQNFALNNLTGSYGAKYLWDIIQHTLYATPREYNFTNV